MHSRDSAKSDPEFQREFERIWRGAGQGLADFSRFIFPKSEYFGRDFVAKCCFDGATFTRNAGFPLATFAQNAYFRGARFTESAVFTLATFTQNADFSGATFTQDGDFYKATFAQNADFRGATFMQEAKFGEATFVRMVHFQFARFAGTAQFRQTKFRQDLQGEDHEPSSTFSGSVFEEPEKVFFYGTNLAQVLFHNRDVAKIDLSDITWGKRANGKWMVFDEAVNPRHEAAEALRPAEHDPNPRNYRLIAELYHQLKKNYDDRSDYWTAGDFHYGEMEMNRLASGHHSKALRWLHNNLGLVAWYKYASDYGENYVKPIWWLLTLLCAFALVYPGTGLCKKVEGKAITAHCEAGNVYLTYASALEDADDKRSQRRARLALIGHGLVTTLYVAAFQKDLTYMPSYPWGRLLALAEVLLTSTLGALFLLAVRRQFKR